MTGMSSSMHNLAQRGQGGGYSSGYMQGFRDGNSGVFGDRISTNLLRRLEEQYPNQEEFRTGYIDGFKEGANSRLSERKVLIQFAIFFLFLIIHNDQYKILVKAKE